MIILLDMDGVVFNSEPAHYASFRDALREAGIPFTAHDFARMRGATAREIIRHAAEKHGTLLPEGEVQRILTRRTTLLKERYLGLVQPHPDLTAILTLPYSFFLWTNARRENAFLLLSLLPVEQRKRLGVISTTDLPVGKPHLMAYYTVRSMLNTSFKHLILIDDTEKNILPAQRLGMHAVHYTLGFTQHTLHPLLLKILSGLDGREASNEVITA